MVLIVNDLTKTTNLIVFILLNCKDILKKVHTTQFLKSEIILKCKYIQADF